MKKYKEQRRNTGITVMIITRVINNLLHVTSEVTADVMNMLNKLSSTSCSPADTDKYTDTLNISHGKL